MRTPGTYARRDLVEAMQWTGTNWRELKNWVGHLLHERRGAVYLESSGGEIPIVIDPEHGGDYIVKHNKHTFERIPAFEFEDLYHEASDGEMLDS